MSYAASMMPLPLPLLPPLLLPSGCQVGVGWANALEGDYSLVTALWAMAFDTVGHY